MLIYFNFLHLHLHWEPILLSVGIITSFAGSFGILFTSKLKEIYAWSSILHTGNILCICSCITSLTFVFVFFYLVGYGLISYLFILLIISLKNRRTGRFIKTLDELFVVTRLNSFFYFIAILIFASSAGFTPLISFFMKFSLFYSLAHCYGPFLIILLGLLNIIGSFTYLKILRSIISFKINFFNF